MTKTASNLWMWGWLVLAVWVGLHVSLLDILPLPWYDDTYFASLSLGWWRDGKFLPTVVASINEHREVIHYGPLNTWFGAFSYQLFGFSPFSTRLPSFVAGVVLLLVFFFFVKNEWKSPGWAMVWTMVFAFDPYFTMVWHDGRPDLWVTCFLFVGYIFTFSSSQNKSRWWGPVFLGLAIMTSPRSIIYLIPWGIFQLFYIKKWKWFLFQSGVILLFPIGWLVSHFQTWESFLFYFSHKNAQEARGYFFNGFPWYVPLHCYFIFGLGLVVSVWNLYVRPESWFKPKVLIALATILCYFVLVVEYGPYTILIYPFVYFLCAYFFKEMESTWVRTIFVGGIFLVFSLYHGLKMYQTYSSVSIRNTDTLFNTLQSNIPAGSKVIGDGLYFYACEQNKLHFQYIDHYGNDIVAREAILAKDFDYQYVLLSDQYKFRYPEDVKLLLNLGKFEPIGRIEYDLKTTKLPGISHLEEDFGYNGTLYKVIGLEK